MIAERVKIVHKDLNGMHYDMPICAQFYLYVYTTILYCTRLSTPQFSWYKIWTGTLIS